MISLPPDKLTSIEKDVVAEIRSLRASPLSDPLPALLESPARLAHHFILASHGNVKLRFSTLAGELGIEMRTLERTFLAEYHKTMTQFQAEVRLAFSKHLLSIFPPAKISVIAVTLGYELVQDFNLRRDKRERAAFAETEERKPQQRGLRPEEEDDDDEYAKEYRTGSDAATQEI